jgi:hypothetical protein
MCFAGSTPVLIAGAVANCFGGGIWFGASFLSTGWSGADTAWRARYSAVFEVIPYSGWVYPGRNMYASIGSDWAPDSASVFFGSDRMRRGSPPTAADTARRRGGRGADQLARRDLRRRTV